MRRMKIIFRSIPFILMFILISGCISNENDQENDSKYTEKDLSWGRDGDLSLSIVLIKNELNCFLAPQYVTTLDMDSIPFDYTLTNIGNTSIRVLLPGGTFIDQTRNIVDENGSKVKMSYHSDPPWSFFNEMLITLNPGENLTERYFISNDQYQFAINHTYFVKGVYKMEGFKEDDIPSDWTEPILPFWVGELETEYEEFRVIG